MARIMDKLTRRQQLVFMFFELDALRGVEIGALLGIGLHRVYRLLYTARAIFLREAAHPVGGHALRAGTHELAESSK
jgi:DNA-directed RNA polymerase specialized sigma24 family protein